MAAKVNTKPGFATATADDVREFGAANGLPVGGTRGRLPKATIEAFNKAKGKGKGRMFYGGTPVGERTYQLVGPKGGVRKQATVKPSIIRQWAAIEGYEVAARGRLPKEVIDAFMAEGV